ncbi:hypothetical protein [Telluribacter sp. SYSU D00476]|uniref:hypothetical protein n=1 Tax=Telluribacter sp. SYSU D00476 TaxID=2811430 RepID=UPI001FF3243F|nr:hypothetical protein [Telluribacter sp. SYSU D00476]
MTYDQFVASLDQPTPPTQVSEVVAALWHDANGDWTAAHEIAQSREGTRDYDLLHAYLHRVEGDTWNANYWYRRAGASMPDKSLKEEWEALVKRWL